MRSAVSGLRVWLGGSAIMVVAVAGACGGGSNGPGPTPPLQLPPVITAPNAEAPNDDSTIEALKPELRVANATSDKPGDRTYEFQMAENAEFVPAAGASALVVSKTGIPEGGEGKTRYEVEEELQRAKRYFWRARAFQGFTAGPWSAAARFRTPSAPNPAPRILSLTSSKPRAEVDTEIALTATVQDEETPAAQLVYEWTADKGAFSGSGAQVRWRAPRNEKTPATYDLKLTVIERFTVTDPDHNTEQRENRATAAVKVVVNDSRKEVTDLTLIFLDDFSHANVSPETCVRNFSDNCAGKSTELRDIRDNRTTYSAITSAKYSVSSVKFDQAMEFADITAPCEFVSVRRKDGVVERAAGACLLTAVYEQPHWWLCDSTFRPNSPLRFVFPF